MNWCNRLLDGEFLSKKSFPLTRTKQGLPMIVHWRHSFITVPHVAFAYDDTFFFQSWYTIMQSYALNKQVQARTTTNE